MGRLKLILWVAFAVAVVITVWWLVNRFGLLGGLILAPIAIATAGVGKVAKTLGAAPVDKPKNKPRRGDVGTTGTGEPDSKTGAKRPRRGGGTWG